MSEQKTRRTGLGNGQRSEYEAWWCLNRPREHSTPLPRPGDTVLYRSNDHFDPITAEVVAVDVDTERDHPCRHLADPWPLLRLAVTPPLPDSKRDVSGLAFPGVAPMRPYLVDCREARLDGSAGWLPLDWQLRHRPRIGQMGPEA